ncbi:hypothetical protein [Thiobacillus sp.]
MDDAITRRIWVYLKEFADDGIVPGFATLIRDPGEGRNNLRSSINRAIWRRFNVAGMEILFAPCRAPSTAVAD